MAGKRSAPTGSELRVAYSITPTTSAVGHHAAICLFTLFITSWNLKIHILARGERRAFVPQFECGGERRRHVCYTLPGRYFESFVHKYIAKAVVYAEKVVGVL